jgi:hypothetical protein
MWIAILTRPSEMISYIVKTEGQCRCRVSNESYSKAKLSKDIKTITSIINFHGSVCYVDKYPNSYFYAIPIDNDDNIIKSISVDNLHPHDRKDFINI